MALHLLRIALVAVACLSSGCALIFTGSTKGVMIHSEPPGAEVLQDGQYRGVTPMQLQYSGINKDVRIELRKQGYYPQSALLARTFEPLAILNCTSVICWGVDILTGAMWRFQPNAITVRLAPADGSTPPPGPPPGPAWPPPPGTQPPPPPPDVNTGATSTEPKRDDE